MEKKKLIGIVAATAAGAALKVTAITTGIANAQDVSNLTGNTQTQLQSTENGNSDTSTSDTTTDNQNPGNVQLNKENCEGRGEKMGNRVAERPNSAPATPGTDNNSAETQSPNT